MESVALRAPSSWPARWCFRRVQRRARSVKCLVRHSHGVSGRLAEPLKEDGRVAISGGILFETNTATLAPTAANLFTKLSDVMKKNPNLKVAVVGHTDNTGDFNYNLQLSQRRAKAMVDALVKDGVAADRLAAVGVGSLSPVAPNNTPEGRAQNRRVELVLIS